MTTWSSGLKHKARNKVSTCLHQHLHPSIQALRNPASLASHIWRDASLPLLGDFRSARCSPTKSTFCTRSVGRNTLSGRKECGFRCKIRVKVLIPLGSFSTFCMSW